MTSLWLIKSWFYFKRFMPTGQGWGDWSCPYILFLSDLIVPDDLSSIEETIIFFFFPECPSNYVLYRNNNIPPQKGILESWFWDLKRPQLYIHFWDFMSKRKQTLLPALYSVELSFGCWTNHRSRSESTWQLAPAWPRLRPTNWWSRLGGEKNTFPEAEFKNFWNNFTK